MKAMSLWAILCFALIFAAEPALAKKHAKKDTLFKSLGGKKAIVAVVDDFVGRCATNEEIKGFFAATAGDPKRLKLFKTRLVDQICQAAGGPCKYRGKNMKDAHVGMNIEKKHFDVLVGELVATLDKFKVKEKDKQKLLAVLGPMEKDIVNAPDRGTASEEPAGQ